MSADPSSTVRELYGLLGGSSIEEIAARLKELVHPAAEWVNPPGAVEGGTRKGLEEWLIAVENLLEGAGTNARYEVEELIENEDLVFVRGFLAIRGTASGVEVNGPTTYAVWTVVDGRATRYEWFFEESDARAVFERGAG